jgi:indole-3-acetate monooxygenase
MTIGQTLSTSSELAERALALVPLVVEHAGYGDDHGRVSPTVIEQLQVDGLFKMWTPAVLGGSELDPVRSLEVIENVSYGDSSTGWVVMAANVSIGTAGAFLSDEAVAELFGEGKRPVIAGQGTRPGVARRVGDKLLLSGSWSFGSGLLHADFVHSLGIVAETGEPRIFVTPIESANVVGNWDVLGLRGTGSVDYTMENVAVDDGWTHFAVTNQPLRGGCLYEVGIIGFATLGHSGWALGVGRRMLDDLARNTREKAGRPGTQADSTAFLQAFAQAESSFRAARAFVLEAWGDATASLQAGEGMSVRQHTLVRAALTHLTKTLHEVGTAVYLASGTHALRDGTMQRFYRDALAGAQHVTSSPAVWQNCGRELLGLADGKMWQFLDLVDAP